MTILIYDHVDDEIIPDSNYVDLSSFNPEGAYSN